MAMLTVEDDEFWSNGVEALELGGVPAQQESVSVLGVSALPSSLAKQQWCLSSWASVRATCLPACVRTRSTRRAATTAA